MVRLFPAKPVKAPFNRFVGDISMRLLRVSGPDTIPLMNNVLGDMAERYGIDRIQLRWIPDTDHGAEDRELEIAGGWALASEGHGRAYEAREVPWVLAKIRAGETMCMDSMDQFPAEADRDRRSFEARGVKAIFILPMSIDDDMFGVLALTMLKPFHWTETMQDEVALLAEIITSAYWGANYRAKLRDSEARYRGVVQDQTDLIVRWAPDGKTTWVNDRMCDYMGMSRDELIGSTEPSFVSVEDMPAFREAVANLTPEEPTFSDEYQVTLKSGERVWQEWIERGIFDEAGKLVEVQSIGRDVTERKLAEATREREAAFQRHKAELLINLTTLKKQDVDRTIRRSLERVGQLYDAARISLWWLSEHKDALDCTHRWLEAGAPPSPLLTTVERSDVQWAFDQLLAGKKIIVPDIEALPADAGQFREYLRQTQCDAYLAFPMVVDGVNFGACTFAAKSAHTWDDLAIDELEILANILATALSRFRASEALSRHAAFQTRLANISSRLLNVPSEQTNQVIGDVLATIGVDYDLDWVSVRGYDDALPGFGSQIAWVPGGGEVKQFEPEEFPWATGLIRLGDVVQIDSVDSMPEEARVDQDCLTSLGVSSVLCLPLLFVEDVYGVATFATVEQRDWDENTILELQLIATALTNAAIRQWSTITLSRREKDLVRSQQVAKVGSYTMLATENDDDESPNLLNIIDLRMSDQALEIFGIGPEPDPRAQIDAALSQIHPDDEPRVREIWRKTLRDHSQHVIEYRVVRPNGTIVHVQARKQFDGIDENGVMTLFGTYKDITQWVDSNQELQVALSEIEELKDQLQEENIFLRDEVRAAHGFDKIIGESRLLGRVLESAEQVAPTDVTVLITGETGTGKELVARSIHDLSHRKDKAMICVNCAALSTELIESELFGHEKGAFTGAHDRRRGRFELADGGTLFLDEIGEISGELQAKLLRVIQEGEFERLGGSRTLRTDVRLIAATNRDLRRAVDDGGFRADLYYRINSFPIHMPPLRDRKEDIPLLAEHLVRKNARILGKDVESISARTLRYLQDQAWPGNIRELEGTILRALIAKAGPALDYVGATGGTTTEPPDSSQVAKMSLLEAQRKHIVDVLEKTNWVIEGKKGAAFALGLAPSSLRSKMKRLDVVRPQQA